MTPILSQAVNFWENLKPQYLWLAGLILLGIVIFWAIARRSKRTLTVTSSDESLRVKISVTGLEDLLRMACGSYPQIESPKTRIVIDGENRVCPHVEFSIAADSDRGKIQEELRKRIEETLSKHLGKGQIGDIEFTVAGFDARNSSNPEGILGTESPIIPPTISPKDDSRD
ncbi:MAG: hypothetical protein HOL08_16895 [Opitutae bacterium]|nr:hypothetical protein [Opitutae bacterium]